MGRKRMHGNKQVSNRIYISVVIGSLVITLLVAGIFYRHNKSLEKNGKNHCPGPNSHYRPDTGTRTTHGHRLQ